MSSVPPPLPPNQSPLEYARPMPPEAPGNTLFHQAAKASWAAPLVLVVLGCFTNVALHNGTPDQTVQVVLFVATIALMVAGVVCGIVALCGVGRYGTRGLLAPAIIGLLLNLAWVVLVVSVVMPAVSRARAVSAARRVPPPAPISSPLSALRQVGWMGYSIDAKYSIGVVAMDDANVDTINLKANFGRDFTALVLWADNRANTAPISVNTEGATVRMQDGSIVNALGTRAVLDTAKADRPQFVAKFAPPFTVGAGGIVEGQLMFLPPRIDMSRVQTIYVTVDGVKVSVPGRIFTAQEKTDRMAPGKPKRQQDPSNL